MGKAKERHPFGGHSLATLGQGTTLQAATGWLKRAAPKLAGKSRAGASAASAVSSAAPVWLGATHQRMPA